MLPFLKFKLQQMNFLKSEVCQFSYNFKIYCTKVNAATVFATLKLFYMIIRNFIKGTYSYVGKIEVQFTLQLSIKKNKKIKININASCIKIVVVNGVIFVFLTTKIEVQICLGNISRAIFENFHFHVFKLILYIYPTFHLQIKKQIYVIVLNYLSHSIL